MEQKMKLGILGTGMIVKEFLPWLAGADSPFQVQALCSTQRSAPLAAELCARYHVCLLYTSPSPRDRQKSRMPSSA